MSIPFRVECDNCGRKSSTHFPMPRTIKVHGVRAELKERGWLVAQPGGLDYCAGCRESVLEHRRKLRSKKCSGKM